MSTEELDRSYTALAEALGRVGEQRSALLLATLALDLIAGHGDPAQVLRLIERAERLSST